MSEKQSTIPYLLLTLALTIFAIAPLTYPGYFQTHAGFTALWAVDNLRENLFNLRWTPPLTGFDALRSGGILPYYLAALLPLPPLAAMKTVSALGVLAGASGLYLWLKSWLGAKGATVAALAYTYAPFLTATLLVRGAFGESFFWGVLPWALLAATYLVASPTLPVMAIAVVFWTALGLSHLGLGVWAWVVLVFMQVGFHRPQSRPPIAMSAIGLAVAAAITVPRALASAAPKLPVPADHLVYPAQLLAPFWGFGISVPGWQDGLTFSVGFAAIALALVSIYIWKNGDDPRPWFFIGVAGSALALVLPWTRRLWQLPLVRDSLAYPWQLLGFAALGLAVLAGIGFWLEPKLNRTPIFAAALLMVLIPAYPHLEPNFITSKIPPRPVAIYGDNQLLLIDYRFEIKNPAEQMDALHPVKPYLPLKDAAALQPGDTFYLTVHWQAVNPPQKSLKIFGHLVDGAGNIITQIDVLPQNGDRPTDGWLPGELIADRYTFTLPADAPAPAQVWLGFYDGDTLARLPVAGDDNGRAKLSIQ